MIEVDLRLETLPQRMTAFLLMAEQAVIAETHAAKRTIELLTMKNLMPAFTAFNGSIDQLKHPMLIPTFWRSTHQDAGSGSEVNVECCSSTTRLTTIPSTRAMKNPLQKLATAS